MKERDGRGGWLLQNTVVGGEGGLHVMYGCLMGWRSGEDS